MKILQSHWLFILKNDVHLSKSLEDIVQNHWNMKYKTSLATFLGGQKLSHKLVFQQLTYIKGRRSGDFRLIILEYDVDP